MNLFEDVSDLYEGYGFTDGSGPSDPHQLSRDVADFRIGFLQEELDEYIKAVDDEDLEGQLDALVDIVIVALGTADLSGFNNYNEAFRRVQEANRAKVVGMKPGREFRMDLVKPEGWRRPDLSDLVEVGEDYELGANDE